MEIILLYVDISPCQALLNSFLYQFLFPRPNGYAEKWMQKERIENWIDVYYLLKLVPKWYCGYQIIIYLYLIFWNRIGHENNYLINLIECKFVKFRVWQNKVVNVAFLTQRKWNAIKNFLRCCNLIKFAINQQRISRHKSNRINGNCKFFSTHFAASFDFSRKFM